ncbi:MAG: transaldolase, partial [Pseudonocardiales bacterium]|nr:transaldolase [Pseudonocardiales bacterium]
MSDALADLSALGVSIWLDDISRERLVTGNLRELIDTKHVVGVTSNPSIFQKAMEGAADGNSAYAQQVHDLAVREVALEEAVRLLTAYDIRWACDVLRPVYDSTSGKDGRVSIEVDPRIAHDTDKTTAEAAALWWLVDRPNVLIKIPATEAGLASIADSTAAGIS